MRILIPAIPAQGWGWAQIGLCFWTAWTTYWELHTPFSIQWGVWEKKRRIWRKTVDGGRGGGRRWMWNEEGREGGKKGKKKHKSSWSYWVPISKSWCLEYTELKPELPSNIRGKLIRKGIMHMLCHRAPSWYLWRLTTKSHLMPLTLSAWMLSGFQWNRTCAVKNSLLPSSSHFSQDSS